MRVRSIARMHLDLICPCGASLTLTTTFGAHRAHDQADAWRILHAACPRLFAPATRSGPVTDGVALGWVDPDPARFDPEAPTRRFDDFDELRTAHLSEGKSMSFPSTQSDTAITVGGMPSPPAAEPGPA